MTLNDVISRNKTHTKQNFKANYSKNIPNTICSTNQQENIHLVLLCKIWVVQKVCTCKLPKNKSVQAKLNGVEQNNEREAG